MMLGIGVLNARLKNFDVGRIEPWASLARRNSPARSGIAVPLLIAQNPKDDLVAPSVTRAYAHALCAARTSKRGLAPGARAL